MNSQKNNQAISPRKSLSRIALQIFVWALVIAFVSTLGVMWDGSAGGGFPVVIKSSKGDVNLSPNELYMAEYNKLDGELRTNISDIDPRVYNDYLKYASLTNTANTLARQLFYNEIKLTPSPKRFREIQANSGVSSNLANLQYADFQYTFPLGVLPSLAAPTVSDMYALQGLQNLQIAAEILVLNRTNFLYSKIEDTEAYTYYQQNFERWLDSITVQEIIVENRAQARRVITALPNQNLEQISSSIEGVTVNQDKTITITADNYTYVNEILSSVKSNQTVVGPIYNKGQYSVVVITNITTLDQLPTTVQNRVLSDYVNENFDMLSKKHESEWKASLDLLKVGEDESFSSVNIAGIANQTLQPFTLLQQSVTNVLGTALNLPLLTSPNFINAVLYTPLNEASEVISVDKDLFMIVRPRLREHPQNVASTESIYNDPKAYQDTLQYKEIKLNESMNSKLLKNKFKIITLPKNLTNLN